MVAGVAKVPPGIDKCTKNEKRQENTSIKKHKLKNTQKQKDKNTKKKQIHRKNAHQASGQRAAATARRAEARRARIMIMSKQRLIFVSGAYREKLVSGQQGHNYLCKKGSIFYKRSIHQTLLKDIDKLAVGHTGQTKNFWAKPSTDKKMRRLSKTIAVLCKEYIHFSNTYYASENKIFWFLNEYQTISFFGHFQVQILNCKVLSFSDKSILVLWSRRVHN